MNSPEVIRLNTDCWIGRLNRFCPLNNHSEHDEPEPELISVAVSKLTIQFFIVCRINVCNENHSYVATLHLFRFSFLLYVIDSAVFVIRLGSGTENTWLVLGNDHVSDLNTYFGRHKRSWRCLKIL